MQSQRTIGISLCGGGAKGAYHAGFFQGVEELGLWDRITAFAGTSIGALNAMLAMHRSSKTFFQAWEGFTTENLGQLNPHAVGVNIADIYPIKKERYLGMTLEQYLEVTTPTPFLTDCFGSYIARYMPPEAAFGAGRPRAHLCAYNMRAMQPEYFCLNDLSPQDRITLIRASCALPVVFPPVGYGQGLYCDGGVVPPFSAAGNSDIAPVLPFMENTPDIVIIVYLNRDSRTDTSCLPRSCTLLEQRPSQPLEAMPGTGTLDFSPESRKQRENLGYKDSLALLKDL